MPPPGATQAAARLWTQPTLPFPACLSYCSSVEITRTLWWQTRFTWGHVREWKSGHNSITVQNRTHVYMKFFDHKDLGNHFLQLCPKVVKHSVYLPHCHVWRILIWTTYYTLFYYFDYLKHYNCLPIYKLKIKCIISHESKINFTEGDKYGTHLWKDRWYQKVCNVSSSYMYLLLIQHNVFTIMVIENISDSLWCLYEYFQIHVHLLQMKESRKNTTVSNFSTIWLWRFVTAVWYHYGWIFFGHCPECVIKNLWNASEAGSTWQKQRSQTKLFLTTKQRDRSQEAA
jgi:hypothetical protein